MAVTVQDFSVQVKARLNQLTINALTESGFEVAAHANSNVQLEDDAGQKLRGSYRSEVDASVGKATVGTSLEEGFWEEFGTGSHADTAKNGGIPGRPMWWVYVTNETPRTDNPVYRTEEEAKAVAASWRAEGKDAHATNGREPNYTLEKAFIAKKGAIVRNFERTLESGLGR